MMQIEKRVTCPNALPSESGQRGASQWDRGELVWASIARQLGERAPVGARLSVPHMVEPRLHASHGRYAIAREDDIGPFIIELSVPCTHCNYCKSHGH